MKNIKEISNNGEKQMGTHIADGMSLSPPNGSLNPSPKLCEGCVIVMGGITKTGMSAGCRLLRMVVSKLSILKHGQLLYADNCRRPSASCLHSSSS